MIEDNKKKIDGMERVDKEKNNDERPRDAVLYDLAERKQEKSTRSRFTTSVILAGLLAGLIGGTVGGTYLAPLYQEKVLGETTGNISENRKVVLDEDSAVIDSVSRVNPAVVSIVITKDLPKLEQLNSPFGFFTAPSGQTEKQQVGAGSGFIVTKDGLIVTNKHVVDDSSAEYTVIMNDGKQYSATVVSTDPFNDLAVVKISANNLPTVTLGDSDQLKLGQRVVAIGNALGQFQNSVTTGVVSGIGRDITASGGAVSESLSEVIQTDAAINPGNSGGPLINLAGEVIGVNTAVSQQAQLIGFAIPINQVKKVIDDVKQFGRVKRPFLGVRYVIVTDAIAKANNLKVNYGAMILPGENSQDVAVLPGSPAANAGLKENDIILELNGEKITTEKPLSQVLRAYNPGDRVTLKVLRGDKEENITVTLGEAT